MSAYQYEHNGRTFVIYKATNVQRWFARMDNFQGELVQTVKPCTTRKQAVQAGMNYIEALFA